MKIIIEKIKKKIEEEKLIQKCIEVRASFLEARIAGVLWKRDGVEAGLLFLDSMKQGGCAVIS